MKMITVECTVAFRVGVFVDLAPLATLASNGSVMNMHLLTNFDVFARALGKFPLGSLG